MGQEFFFRGGVSGGGGAERNRVLLDDGIIQRLGVFVILIKIGHV